MRETMNKLKQKLLSFDVFVDCEYLDRYVDLILLNSNRVYEKFKTQRHHIVPVCYFKSRELPVDNNDSNIVTLLYRDHVLAHYYLSLATNDAVFQYCNIMSLKHVLGNKNFKLSEHYETEIAFVNSLESIQELYECARRHQSYIHSHLSDASLMRMSNSHKNKKHTDEHKQKISSSCKGHVGYNKGMKWYTNGTADIQAFQCPVGFIPGRACVNTHPNPATEDFCKRMSEISIAREREKLLVHKQSGELYEYEKEVLIRESTRKHLWMNNGVKEVQVKVEDEHKFLLEGYRRGRIKGQKFIPKKYRDNN